MALVLDCGNDPDWQTPYARQVRDQHPQAKASLKRDQLENAVQTGRGARATGKRKCILITPWTIYQEDFRRGQHILGNVFGF